MAFRFLSTLKESSGQTKGDWRAHTGDILVGTVNGDVYNGILVNISQSQVGSDDELLRLESWYPGSSQELGLRDRSLDLPVGMNTRFLLSSAPWATILSTTYGTVEPFFYLDSTVWRDR